MIELFYAPSGNVVKVLLFLEESGTAFKIHPVDVANGEQYSADFASRFPNSKVPAIIDHNPVDGKGPFALFESAAILFYLAEKTGQFVSLDPRKRLETLQWAIWQVAGFGPIGGQLSHFLNMAPEPLDYPIKRFRSEYSRLLGVLEKRLEGREFIMGDYSIADMACFPRVVGQDRRGQFDWEDYPNIERWFGRITERPATARARAWSEKVTGTEPPKGRDDFTPEQRRILFGEHAQ